MKTTQLLTIELVECEREDVTEPWEYRYDVKVAGWLEFVPAKHANRLLKEALKQLEDSIVPYYILSQAPGAGDWPPPSDD